METKAWNTGEAPSAGSPGLVRGEVEGSHQKGSFQG